jgi:TolB-like protein
MSGTYTALSGVFAGRYAIERELGRGGTAIVYLARDQQRGHAVAIKVLRAELAESVGAERFLKEIQLSQQLHHPQIVPVLDSGKYDGQLFFVLPHMEGGTLRQRLEQNKQLPLEEAIAITRSIANALAHAHEKGLVHRDVKPENILFTSGQACLSDFGIARALERAMDITTTSTSVVRGTPPYMSPEQASGEKNLDGRSDIYSLGCVVYEMLAGMQPFVGPTPQSVIAQRLTHSPRPVRMYRPALPSAVEEVVTRALAVSQADRYQVATELADALENASRTSDDWARAEDDNRRRRRSRNATIAMVVTLAAAVATIVIMATRSAGRAEEGIPEGDPRRIAVLYLDDLTPSVLPAYVADGITEDLIDQLGSVRALYVISPNGVRQFRGRAIPVDSIGRALKVGTIVSGSVARSDNTMRINVRFIDARNGQQLYSQTLEQPWAELFSLQDTLAKQVAFFLRKRVGDEVALREHRSATKSYAAWETAQLAGSENQRASAGDLRGDPQAPLLFLRADSLYVRAQQLDPSWNYPTIRRGYIALSLSLQSPVPPKASDSIAYGRMTPTERKLLWTRRALELSDLALQQSARSAEAFALRGEARYRLLAAGAPGVDSLGRLAERDLRAAVELRPDAAIAWSTLAQLSMLEGKFADAAAAAQRAFDADAYFEVRRTVAVALTASLFAEHFDDARRWCRFGLTHYGGDPRFAQCELTILGWTGRSRDDVAAAWRLLGQIEQRDTLRLLSTTWAYQRLMVAAVMARSGMGDSARNLLGHLRAQERSDPTKRSAPLGEAYVRLLLNDRDSAFVRLGEYLRNTPVARAQVATHPWFRPLRGDPRFEALVQPAR